MLRQEERLVQQLRDYSASDYYPFHMPGHKRNTELGKEYNNPFEIDITEISGFDNLHHPEGILKAAAGCWRPFLQPQSGAVISS